LFCACFDKALDISAGFHYISRYRLLAAQQRRRSDNRIGEAEWSPGGDPEGKW
jgi:hypothetical protein